MRTYLRKKAWAVMISNVAVISLCSVSWAQKCSLSAAPQGISCLHCMDPRVKESTPALVGALADSCIANVALGFVVDGSFGFDESIIKKSVELLLQKNKQVSLHIYLLNGSAIRKAGAKLFFGFLNGIPPDVLRERIKNDKKIKDQIMQYGSHFVPLLRWAHSNGVKISLCPMLEDNLDNAAFGSLLNIFRSVIPVSIKVKWVRNPCPDCFIGNESGLLKSVVREDHSGVVPLRSLTSVVSNDGWGYVSFKKDSLLVPSTTFTQGRIQRSLRLSELSPVRDAALNKGASFLLWLSKYQNTLMGKTQLPWKERNLPKPTTQELSEITDFFGR